MYVVTGATGNTGSVVAEKLLSNRQHVRVVGRDAKRLERFTSQGAEGFVADVTDAAALTKAFTGADAAYLLIPPNLSAPDVTGYQRQVAEALASAVERSGARYAVVLSSFGAEQTQGTGPVLGLHGFEERLNRIGALNALYLRAGYFMENVLPQVGVIKGFGSLAGPVRGDLALPMIATRDIGAFAADALAKREMQGKRAQELLGPRDVIYNEVAQIIGAAIGRPNLRYMQLPGAQLKPALLQMGMSESMANGLLTMSDALNSGQMRSLESRSAQNTTPTTFEQFVTEYFVPAFRGEAAHA
jgi:uncharacterized protein YbjT (DUF2867 family)